MRKIFYGMVMAGLFTSGLFSTATAQEVVLKTRDGAVELTGKLLGFDGEFYTIETDLGVLTVDGRTVDCSGTACPEASDMVSSFAIAGSGDLVSRLMPALIEAYAFALDGQAGIKPQAGGPTVLSVSTSENQILAAISLDPSGSEAGFDALATGNAQIVATNRWPSESATAKIRDRDRGNLSSTDQRMPLALDGLVAVVSSVNPIRSLSLEQIGDVFSGKITNWSELGGPDADITVYAPKPGTDFFQLSTSLVFTEPAGFSTAAISLTDSGDVSDATAADPFGIGLVSYSSIRNARALALRGSCGAVFAPTPFAIKSGEYPLIVENYLYLPKERLPVFARELLDFVRSDTAQAVIADTGFIGLSVQAEGLEKQGLRLANAIKAAGENTTLTDLKRLVDILNGAQRLSTTFRLQPGSTKLDERSRYNTKLLAEGLVLGNYADKIVYLAGFSDAQGTEAENERRSMAWADLVQVALIEAAPEASLNDVEFVVAGFGQLAPLGCKDTVRGQQVNRRVEVWIKDRN
jgi:phosphate transport system substrate-binding protein